MSLGLALIGVVMMAGSLSLVDIVEAQDGVWYVLPQFVGFLIFTVAGFAETNRPPFDLPEADAELVGGYNTEFGGMRFGSFFMAEYINMIVIAGLASAMFLGGWRGPGPGFLDPLWMVAEDVRVVVFFIWVRATLPRLRYDQLMSFGWKVLLPLATLNLLVTAILVATCRDLSRMTYRPERRHRSRSSAGPSRAGSAASTARVRRDAARPRRPPSGASSRGRSRSSTRRRRRRSTRASAAGTSCTASRTPSSRSASAARSAPPPARPTASASSPPRTRPRTASRAGERYAEVYEINMTRCIFCGYCEVACPFDAITMGHDYELSDYNRSDLIFTKEMLLAEPVERTR